MIEPVEFQDLFLAAAAGALVILAGAAYALIFAWSRVRARPRFMPAAYAAYALFCMAVWLLARTLHLTGFWQILVVLMLLGYLLAPHAIWHLCVGTHGGKDATKRHGLQALPEKSK
ncbi:MAG: hypothetical protein MJA83_12670 [Gammaproteobacteria bacterium]|nr:hypothetical protein [Gammaproteobacteria bacterium]